MENYEQKYKEALEKAKEFFNSPRTCFDINQLTEIFPELRESEDERIRKWLINKVLGHVDDIHVEGDRLIHNVDIDNYRKALAWLEKQGEQMPTDKVEPKFKVCDWCIDNEDGTIFQIAKVLDNTYTYKTNEGEEYSCTHYLLEKDTRLWAIQDAKDGDVLKEDSCIFIIERMKPDGTAIVHCCLFDDGDFDLVGSTLSFDVDSTYPATKEQRDILFQKMKEAGYEWDAEKKELRTIEQEPTWSEDDEKMWLQVINEIEAIKSNSSTIFEKNIAQDKIDWLKSIKPHSKQEWREEEIEALNDVRHLNPGLDSLYWKLKKS